MQGPKTHEQQLRTLERKPSVNERLKPSSPQPDRGARKSEFPISRQGMNQESQHNKHNNSGQSGHKPQQPTEQG